MRRYRDYQRTVRRKRYPVSIGKLYSLADAVYQVVSIMAGSLYFLTLTTNESHLSG